MCRRMICDRARQWQEMKSISNMGFYLASLLLAVTLTHAKVFKNISHTHTHIHTHIISLCFDPFGFRDHLLLCNAPYNSSTNSKNLLMFRRRLQVYKVPHRSSLRKGTRNTYTHTQTQTQTTHARKHTRSLTHTLTHTHTFARSPWGQGLG